MRLHISNRIHRHRWTTTLKRLPRVQGLPFPAWVGDALLLFAVRPHARPQQLRNAEIAHTFAFEDDNKNALRPAIPIRPRVERVASSIWGINGMVRIYYYVLQLDILTPSLEEDVSDEQI